MPEHCSVTGCEGDQFAVGKCLGHLSEAEYEEAARRPPDPISARNARIDGARVTDFLHRRTYLRDRLTKAVDFSGAVIDGDVRIGHVELAADLLFVGAEISGRVTVESVTGLAHLRLGALGARTTRMKGIDLRGCTGADDELQLHVLDVAERVGVHGNAFRSLGMVSVTTGLLFLSSTRVHELQLLDIAFGYLQARDLSVSGGSTIVGAFGERVSLTDCHFESWIEIKCTSPMRMQRCTFEGPLQLTWTPPPGQARTERVAAPSEAKTELALSSVRFTSTAHLRWGRGDVALDGVIFSAASSLEQAPGSSLRPRLVSVRELDGEHLRISDVRISDCRLRPAASIGVIDPARLEKVSPLDGWTRRRYIRDEKPPPAIEPDDDLETHQEKQRQLDHYEAERKHPTLFAARIAAMYRELRTKAEAAGDHAGANELHYSERLWQRRASRYEPAQWLWLIGYGLVGFGVRPWRPLAWLVALVLVAGFALGASGLERERVLHGTKTESETAICERGDAPATPADRQSVSCPVEDWDAVEFAARSSTGIVRPPTGYVTDGSAAWIEVATRLLAALLFALFVLAVRNRVRR